MKLEPIPHPQPSSPAQIIFDRHSISCSGSKNIVDTDDQLDIPSPIQPLSHTSESLSPLDIIEHI
jgi:hypothetical protein